MSGYIGIDGVARKIKGLYVGVDGVARTVKKAYVGDANGTARLWHQRGTPLGNLAVGSTVKIAVGGTDYDWLVVHQGLPGSMYDTSCDGVWVVMKGIYTTSTFGNGNSYKNSSIHSCLDSTFYNLIDSQIRAVIKQVKIPYTNSGVHNGANGLSTKVFLLSGMEAGFSSVRFMNTEGAKLSYFDSASKRVAYNGSSAAGWWLRSPLTTTSGNVWCVTSDGSSGIRDCSRGTGGVRPCMILPQDALVDDTGHIIAA